MFLTSDYIFKIYFLKLRVFLRYKGGYLFHIFIFLFKRENLAALYNHQNHSVSHEWISAMGRVVVFFKYYLLVT